MSEHGIIIEWDDDKGWGTIRLDNGQNLRFNRNACGQGVTCSAGAEAWVAQHVPYIGGQRRATSVQPNAHATLSPFDLLNKKSELDQALTDRIIRELGSSFFKSTPHERVPHIDDQLAALGIQVHTRILEDPGEPLGVAYVPDELSAWCPFDPCFFAFARIDGNAWGFLCYPPLLARGDAPIVKWDHEGSPMELDAPTFSHWLAKRAKSNLRKAWLAARGFTAPAPVSTTALAKTVRAIVSGTPLDASSEERGERVAAAAYAMSDKATRLARLDELLAWYRALRWPEILVERAEVQRGLILAEQAHEAEVARIKREHRLAHADVYQ